MKKNNSPWSNTRHAFTLLEIVIVLALAALLIGWFALNVATVEKKEKLLRAASSLEVMAKRGRNVAVTQQRPYLLTISAEGIGIAPVNRFSEEDEHFEAEGERKQFPDVVASEKLDGEVKYEIRRWRSDIWEEVKGDRKITLRLDPVGLVEPVSIRCSMGESWIIQELHPLTAGVRDEEMSVEKD